MKNTGKINLIQAWLLMWRNIFNYSGTASIREFWLGLVGNVIGMYAGIIPLALVLVLYAALGGMMSEQSALVLAIVYVLAMHLPVLSLLVRRMRDTGFTWPVLILMVIGIPMMGAMLIGIMKKAENAEPMNILQKIGLTLLLAGFGMALWGALFNMLTGGEVLLGAGFVCMIVGLPIGYIGAKIEESRS